MNHWKKIKRRIAKLANKALKNKPIWNPPKGHMYLKDVQIGQLVEVHNSNTQAILLDKTPSSAYIYCTKHKTNDSFYLGEHKWALKTIIKIIKK
tara:strand:- start:334 stop:615 length:282 start_codon:yes stop_codon:yes gene_type:complete